MTCKHCGKEIVQGTYGPKPFHKGTGLMHCDIHRSDKQAAPKTKDDFIKDFLKQNL